MDMLADGAVQKAETRKRPLMRTALTIYGSLIVLWLLVPSAVVDWCDDFAEKSPAWAFPLVMAGSDAARQVEAASRAVHLADLYPLVRAKIRPLLEP